MHPHLAEVFGHLDESRALLRAAIDAVPRELRPRRPAPDRWSVTDIIEHLALAEQRFTGFVSIAVAKARRDGRREDDRPPTPIPERVAAIMADRTNRRTAPEAVQPRGGIDDRQAWAALQSARLEFRATVMAADGLALGQAVYEHPSLGALTVYQWVELVARHEARHVEQIREVASQIAGAV